VTGVTNVVPARQQMLAIQSYKPFKKIGVLYAGNAKNSQVIVQEVTDLGKELGYTVVARTFNTDANGEPSVHGVRGLVHSLKADGAEWLYLLPDSFLGDALYEVIPAADAERLPTFGSTEQMMQGGALAGIICKYYSLGQLTGYKAEQILVQRKDPRTIPVETLSRFSFQVTLPLAMRFGMTPPIEMFNYAEILTKIGQAPKPKKGA
jgi:putative ABC transport system substrate-binding protein